MKRFLVITVFVFAVMTQIAWLPAYLPLSGGTITGDLTVSGDATTGDDVLVGDDVKLATTGRVSFDTDLNTYIYCNADDSMLMVLGGSSEVLLDATVFEVRQPTRIESNGTVADMIVNGIVYVSSTTAPATKVDYADGTGDMYVRDELEVDGNALFSGSVFLYNPVKCYWSILMTDTRPILYGTDSDFGEAYYTTNDEYRFFRGGSLSIDANVAFRVTASTVVAIGDAGTMNYADGSGDLYVEDELEVAGITNFVNTAYFRPNGSLQGGFYNGYFLMRDDYEYVVGTGDDFATGYNSSADEYRLVRGNNVATDANVAFRVTASTIVAIGDAGTMNFVDGSGDLYVEDDLEVGSDININNGYVSIIDNKSFVVGTGNDFSIGYTSFDDQFRIVRGKDVTSGSKTAFRITVSTVVAIGDAGTMDYAADSGDLYVEDELEVDGTANFAAANFSSTVQTNANLLIQSVLRLNRLTEAQLKALEPAFTGIPYYDTTNLSVVVSTGTTVGSFGLITDGTQLPTGW